MPLPFLSQLLATKPVVEPESEDSDDNDFKMPVQTSYHSADVAIPADFLSCINPPPDFRPVTANVIDFTQTPLPEYKGLYAVVLDNVLSPSECETLLRLAEASVPEKEHRIRTVKVVSSEENKDDKRVEGAGKGEDKGKKARKEIEKVKVKDPWRPALVNVGGGYEALYKDYRNSDRIIWDHQDLVDRLWARCATAPGGLAETLAVVGGESEVLGSSRSSPGKGETWAFRRLNKRMRFLKYQGGQFFRPHCDGPYREPDKNRHLETLFTLHLYLNDSKLEAEEGEARDKADLLGGATTFLSANEKRRLNVDPKAGRVLIFQHRKLYHSGDDVRAGTKYTMRTDMIYEKIGGS